MPHSVLKFHLNLFTPLTSRWIGNISGAIGAGQCAAIEAVDELRPQALSAQDYTLLRKRPILSLDIILLILDLDNLDPHFKILIF